MASTIIWAPAEVLEVRVELGPPENAGVMETLVMRALRAGMETVSQLSELVGVPPRIMLDLIGDIWRSGKIEVDIGLKQETIRLSRDGAAWLAALADDADADGSGRTTHTTEVLVEKLTGRVLPIRAGRGRVDRALRVPRMDGDRDLADVRVSELGGAIESNLRDRDEDADRFAGRRIIEAHLVPALARRASGVRYVPIECNVTVDGDELRIRADDRSLTIEQRELASRRLEGAIAAAPQSAFARELRENHSAGWLEQSGTPQSQADDLVHAAGSLEDASPANRQSEHARVANQAEQLLQLADDRAEREVPTRLLLTRDEHDAEILRLIRAAKHQLVIAVPWVQANGMVPFTSALRDATARGVTVLLLWGVEKEGEELRADLIPELNEIQREGRQADKGGRIVYHKDISAHVHAKVMIADDRHAIVTSRNFFSGSTHREVGVVIDAVDGRRSRVHEELLQWASSVAPSAELLSRMVLRGEDFGEPRAAEALLRRIELPRWDPRLADDESSVAQLWAQEWRATADAIASRIRRAGPVVQVVSDAAHQAYLRRAISTAQSRLIITSDRFSSHAVTGDLVRRLRDAAGRVDNMQLAYGRLGDQADQLVVDQLASPSDGAPAPIEHIPGHHSKVIVADDIATIGSYNYLSFDGTFRRGRYSAELSLRIESPELSDALAATYGVPAPERAIDPSADDRRSAQPAAAAARALELIFGEPAPAEQSMAEAVTVLRPAEDGGELEIADVLQALEAADERTRERVLATLVARASELPEATVHQVDEWRRDLVDALWSRGEWQGAAALARFDASVSDSERAFLLAAAASDDQLVGRMTDVAVQDDLDAAACEALSVHAVAGMLGFADKLNLRDHLAEWRVHLRDDLAAVVDAGLTYWMRYGSPRRDLLVAEVHRDAGVAALSTRWHRLEDAVTDLRTYLPKNDLGDVVLAHMFGAEEEMGELQRVVTARDVPALTGWADRYRQPDDARWLNQMTRRAGSREMLDGSRRRSFMAKRMTVRKLVAGLLSDTSVTSDSLGEEIEPEARAAIDELVTLTREALSARLDETGIFAALTVDALDRILSLCGDAPERIDDRRPSRFPRYWAGDFFSDEVGDLEARLAEDLVDVREPGDDVAVLLRLGEVGLAGLAFEELEGEGLTSTDVIDALRERVSDAVTDLGGRQQLRREALLRSAERAGLTIDLADLPDPPTPQRETDIDAAYAPAEIRFAGDLRDAVAALRARLPGEVRPIVEALIAEGDLLAAEHAAHNGTFADPWARLSIPWKLATYSPAQISTMLRMPRDRPRWIDQFMPPQDDAAAWAFVDALGALDPAGHPETVRSYVQALQGLVSSRSLTFFTGSDATTVSIDVPVPSMLRGIRSRRLVAVIEGQRDDADLRISTTFGGDREGEVVLDLNAALTILSAKSPEDRQLRLLRFLGARLPMSVLFEPDRFPVVSDPDGAEGLRWLLLVRGLDPGPENVERLLAASGHHPTVLYRLIKSYDKILDAEGRIALELRPDIDAMIADAVILEDLGLPSAIVVLGLMAEIGSADGLTRHDIDEWLADLVPGAGLTIDDDLALLVDEHYLRFEDGSYGMANDAVGRALQRTSADWLPGAVERLVSDLALGDSLDDLRKVRLADLEHARKVPLSTLHARELRIAVGDYAPVSTKIDVAELVYRTVADAETPDVRVLAIVEAAAPLEVFGHPNYLTLLLRNALANAVRAARGSERPRVHVLVTADKDEITIDVDDSGAGFASDEIDGLGHGFAAMTEYARRLGGRWERGDATGLPGGQGLGGARVRFVLPRSIEPPLPDLAKENPSEVADGLTEDPEI